MKNFCILRVERKSCFKYFYMYTHSRHVNFQYCYTREYTHNTGSGTEIVEKRKEHEKRAPRKGNSRDKFPDSVWMYIFIMVVFFFHFFYSSKFTLCHLLYLLHTDTGSVPRQNIKCLQQRPLVPA